MFHSARSIRFATLRLTAASLVIGLASFAAAILPATSVSATPPAPVRSTPLGALLATLKDPPGTSGDKFGWSVAVSGTTAVVGAGGTLGQGAAFIYTKGASGWPTTPTKTLSDPTATSGDKFGWSVAVSGTTAIVGAPGTNSSAGAAYIYKA